MSSGGVAKCRLFSNAKSATQVIPNVGGQEVLIAKMRAHATGSCINVQKEEGIFTDLWIGFCLVVV